MKKIPDSPRPHNFNACVPECGSLGTRLYMHSVSLRSILKIQVNILNLEQKV